MQKKKKKKKKEENFLRSDKVEKQNMAFPSTNLIIKNSEKREIHKTFTLH